MQVTVNWRAIALAFLMPARLVLLTLGPIAILLFLLDPQMGLRQVLPLLAGATAVGMTVVVLFGLASLYWLARAYFGSPAQPSSGREPALHLSVQESGRPASRQRLVPRAKCQPGMRRR